MGQLIAGKWSSEDQPRHDAGGNFNRQSSTFRNWIGEAGANAFPPEPGRYHLFAAKGCPWAHRALIYYKLKGLEGAVSLSLAKGTDVQGWLYGNCDLAPSDIRAAIGAEARSFNLHEFYALADPDFTGRATTPVLWDRVQHTIVNNESSDIIRMFNSVFDQCGAKPGDYYPQALRTEIDAMADFTHRAINEGVYKSGYATTQEAYESACRALFEGLDEIENILSGRRYLAGNRVTEADWRFFSTLVRFDVAYFSAFKCNLRRIADYPNLSNYLRELYQFPGVAETVDLEMYKRGYFSAKQRNPSGIIPLGPEIDLSLPHDRARFKSA